MKSKKGGSQLAQLRSGLREAGVTTHKPKKGKSNEAGDRVGPYRKEQRRKRLETLMTSLNAFEQRTSHHKNDVLGRKVKGTTGRPGASKSNAIQVRRDKLLPELDARHRSSSFVDRRFGEYNPNLSLEDKMLQRFTSERQNRTNKASLFDLNDDEDSGAGPGLTHYGQSLSGLDAMPDVMHEDDDQDNIDSYQTQQHFAGFEEGHAERNKNDVMKEIIAKSKLAKAERQKAKDADDEMRMELDEELGDIRSLLYTRPNPELEEDEQQPKQAEASNDDQNDAYDAFVREMAYERRAKPQDRLKSAEELEAEQAKKLRDAEADRLRRMHGDRASPEQDLDDEVHAEHMQEAPMTARSRFGLGMSLDEQRENVSEDDDDDDPSRSEQESGTESGAESGTELDDGESDAQDAQPEFDYSQDSSSEHSAYDSEGAVEETAPGRNRSLVRTEEVPTLPYTFPCPTTHDGLLDILEEHQVQASQLNTVVSRIRTLHAPNLHENNPEKLQRFLGVLIDHLLYRASQCKNSEHDAEMVYLNDLLLHIAELTRLYPARSAEHFVAKFAMMQRNLTRGLSHDPLQPDARTWPALPELCLLRAASMVWPTSDRWHPCSTPLALLMAQYLAHARIRCLEDLASALFVCSLCVSNQRESKRLLPEVINVLYSICAILLPKIRVRGKLPAKQLAEQFGIPTPDLYANHTENLAITKDATPVTPLCLVSLLRHAPDTAQTRADLLQATLELQESLATMYTNSPAFVEIFTPVAFLWEVGAAELSKSAPILSGRLSSSANKLRAGLEHAVDSRRALRLQAHRAVSLTSYAPKFDQQGFDPKRAMDPDAERAQNAKLRALLKKERKGAIRELRKDSQFVAEVREQRRAEEDAQYQRKMQKITHGLQEERSEEKQQERAKATLRKRAGQSRS
ncbi:nucleolar complex protein 14 [Malassezia yamatoensis]|uniref:Nucleolar complex protein 14 n=1 Tax=Malassezia yamatoensis TaxID=253288 RepID=A0AAJ5YXN1_9BASI|nr:nucleolar complex protein 14 [Malassezia yamatoensis]